MNIETQWIVRKSHRSLDNAIVKDLLGTCSLDGVVADDLPWKERSGETIVISREIAMFKARMIATEFEPGETHSDFDRMMFIRDQKAEAIMRTIEDTTDGEVHKVTTIDEVIEEHHAS